MNEISVVSGRGPTRMTVLQAYGDPVGFAQQTISSSSSSSGLPSIPSSANHAIVQLDSTGTPVTIRWRDDGTNPTSTVGMELFPGNVVELSTRASTLNFQAILESSGSSILNVSYYSRLV